MKLPHVVGLGIGLVGLTGIGIAAARQLGGDDASDSPTPAIDTPPPAGLAREPSITVAHVVDIFWGEPSMKLTREGVALLSRNREDVVLYRADQHGPADRSGRADGKVDRDEFAAFVAHRFDGNGDGCLLGKETDDVISVMHEDDFPASVERWGPQDTFDGFTRALDLDDDGTVSRAEAREARATYGYPLSHETWAKQH